MQEILGRKEVSSLDLRTSGPRDSSTERCPITKNTRISATPSDSIILKEHDSNVRLTSSTVKSAAFEPTPNHAEQYRQHFSGLEVLRMTARIFLDTSYTIINVICYRALGNRV